MAEESRSAVFEATSAEYDEMWELLYAWYYTRLHHLIIREIIAVHRPRHVLDVACGTGLQSVLHALPGGRVIGLDRADRLLRVAAGKTASPGNAPFGMPLRPYFDFVRHYQERGHAIVEAGRHAVRRPPVFVRGDARRLPFGDGRFDHVNFVGAASFVDGLPPFLQEIHRVLEPGGTLFMDAEARWHFQLGWQLLGRCSNGGPALDRWCRMVRDMLARPRQPVRRRYPFKSFENLIPIPETCYTAGSLRTLLARFGLDVLSVFSIHVLTGLLHPDCLLQAFPPPRICRLFRMLTRFEERFPKMLPGMQLAVVARKRVEASV